MVSKAETLTILTTLGVLAVGCVDNKQKTPIPNIPPSSPASPTKRIPRPTAEVGRAVPIEISQGVTTSLTQPDLTRIKTDMLTYLSLFRCSVPSVTFTTIAEGKPAPGVIMVDLEAINEAEKNYSLPHGLLLRSTVLQGLSFSCYEAENFRPQTFDIGGGFKIRTNPGLNLTFIPPNGIEQDSQVLPRGISGALAGFITGEGFATDSVQEANIVLFTKSLFNNQKEAQTLNDIMYRGDFPSFVAFVRGRSPVQIKQEDMQAVLTWYGRAQNAQSQQELDNIIKEMLESRGKDLNTKTNFRMDIQEMSLTQLKRRFKDTNDGAVLREIRRRQRNNRVNTARKARKERQLIRQNKERTKAAFAKQGAVV